ncbi:adenylate/guanylate cyclase domain-containing protein [Methylomonas paludis]|uniref:Adenylate/guanylate cyclase domain-containing protein n=1 Tax=Methylomonas paludis TaxID=1173101 RepID=A0A975MQF2_9GAMM|nr:adenylate/guanylate cyclase domain-containing protein [Methylomonas paludis]QWF71895.1 adenylate/guanylate cyclase domain-containing protein [Methylomonas paludis]
MKTLSFLQAFRYTLHSLLVLIGLAYTLHYQPIPVLQRLDQLGYDLRLRATLPNSQDPRIVIVDIDEKSLSALGHWPWPRPRLAQLVDTLFDHYQVRLLAFDVVFAEADNTSPLAALDELARQTLAANQPFQTALTKLRPQLDYDAIFAASLKNRPVILSFFTSREITRHPEQALPGAWADSRDWAFAGQLPDAAGFGGNLALVQQAAADGGYFNNPLVDSDGVFRRIPLLSRYQGQIYPALSLAIYRRLLGAPLPAFSSAGSNLTALRLQQQVIPTAADSSVLVPYRGRYPSFAYYAASDVLAGTIADSQLKGKIVLVGSTAAGLMDLRSTPVQNVFPGVEIQANILSGLLDQQLKYVPDFLPGLEALQILLIGLLSLMLFRDASPLANAGRWLLLLAGLIGGNLYFWQIQHWDCLPASPLVLLTLLFANQAVCAYISTTERKNRLSRWFGLYVAPELVAQMQESGRQYSLSGQSRELSVLFADVRGFTGIAETMPPAELCELINQIFSPLTRAIHHQHGTIDKYIGDAVMAFWGAPLSDPHHARHAIAAALDMIALLPALNDQFNQRGWPAIDIGIGLNTGKMSVGNMGSDFRIAYTVMGDAVNLAARLQGLTGSYGAAIIVSAATRQQAPEFIYRELDTVTVKGKQIPITLYQPLCSLEQATPQLLQQLNQLDTALQHYRQANWAAAEQIFTNLQNQNPGDKLYSLYRQRISHFRTHPPAPNWSGVFVWEVK